MSNTLTDTRPLTRDERDLIVAVRRHLRADGWKLYHREAEHRGAQIAADWTYAWKTDGKDGRVLRVRHLTPHGSTQAIAAEVDVDSVREAVDVAVAIGLLPQGMSSTYQAGRESAPIYTAPLTLTADQVDIGWQLLDASDETSWHLVTEAIDCQEEHAETFVHPELGEMPGYLVGRCGHRVAALEWQAGFRVCERCPNADSGPGCTVLVSTAYQAGQAHMPSDTTVDVRIPAAAL